MAEAKRNVESDDLKSFVRVVWRRMWILIITVVAITSIAVGGTLLLSTKQYQSSAELLQRNSGLDKMILGSSFFLSTNPEREMQTTSELVMSPHVVANVAASLGDRVDGTNVASITDVSTIRESNILRITTTATDPQLAADIANSFASSYIDWRREVDQGVIQQARQSIEAEVLTIPEGQRGSARYQTLNEQLETLELMETMQTGNLEIVKPATSSSVPTSPKPVRTGVMAFLASFILGIGLMFLVEHFDTSLHSTDVVSEALEKPILSIVPMIPSANNGQLQTISNPLGSYSEAFRLLKTNIGYINPDSNTKSMMISSYGPNEGKSTSIANLAVTMARSGQRVIVLEADFRRPSLARILGLDNTYGLTNVIAGTRTLREVLQMIEVRELVIEKNGTSIEDSDEKYQQSHDLLNTKSLYCATSGPLPPNPGEIASSDKLGSLISEAAEYADMVLVDVPPIGVVGDAAAVASRVDGILLVVSLEKNKKKSLNPLQDFIKSVPSNVIGIVINGYKSGRFSDSYYSYSDEYGYYQ